jgi:glycosyltransferase involved in cell wall biosynthesis
MLAPTPYFSDRGCHVRIYEEARALGELGHRVMVATYHLGRDMERIETVRIPPVPWYKKTVAGPSWQKPYLDILLFITALRAGRRFRPDIIHAHLHEGAFVGWLLKKIFRVPLLFDCQGSLCGEVIDHGFFRRGSFIHRLFAKLEGWINRNSDFAIASSASGRDALLAAGMPPEKVTTLIDGVDTAFFRPYPKREARERLKLPADRPVVAYLGLMNRYQGTDILLETVRILRERKVPVHFLVMGFPEAEYVEEARRSGLSEMMTFTGKVSYDDAPQHLSAADLAVSPKISLTEANGKLFNYIACGLPSVVFDNPVNREILGDCGIYAEPGDAEDLAAKIETLLADRERLEALSARSRKKAEREHSWRARALQLDEVYRGLLQV